MWIPNVTALIRAPRLFETRRLLIEIQYMHARNKGGIIIIVSISLLQFLVLQKHSKFERMSGCNYPFIIEKGQSIEWMAATGLANYLNI